MRSDGSSFCRNPQWIAAAAAVLLAGLVSGARSAAPEPGRPPVGQAGGTPVMVARAARACFSSIVHATGYLVARAEAVVEFPIEGYEVAEVLVQEGEIVVERQPVVRLARAPGQSSGGQSNVAAALPASIVLKAPASGRIVAATAMVGALTSPRLPTLFRLAIEGRIEADAEVSSIHLDKIAIDQPARLTPEGEREIGGRVRAIASAVDPVTQMGHVRIAMEGDSTLGAGRFVRMTVDTGESCGISVPLAAVLRTTDGTSVQTVRGNLVETVKVRVGVATDDRIEVQLGLHEGDVVVAHAGTSLRDGDRVAPEFIETSVQPTGRR